MAASFEWWSQYGEKTERNLFTTAQSGDTIWATTGCCSGTKFQPLYICLVMEAICACAMLLKIYIGQSVLDLWI